MDHGLGLIIGILEILEIEVFNILHNAGSIGNYIFLFLSYPGNIGNSLFYILRFFQKRRAPKFHTEWSENRAGISHYIIMRPIQS